MHVTDFEKLDKEHQFDAMLDVIDQDPGFLLWVKMSRLTFGPWQIEEYPSFEKHIEFVTNYNDPRSLVLHLEEWMSKKGNELLGNRTRQS